MNANTSTAYIIPLIENTLHNEHKISTKQKQEVMILVKTVTEQKYLHFNEQYEKQKGGVTTGAPHIRHSSRNIHPISTAHPYQKYLNKASHNRLVLTCI
jgi:hypothetical protein